MRSSPRRIRLIAGAAIGALFALSATIASAASPAWNRDVAGAPRVVAEDGPASLAITVRTCPAGYDPTAEGASFLVDCRESAGDTSFQLSRAGAAGPAASTGTSGDAPQESTVGFTRLTAGNHLIVATAPSEIAGAFVGRCESDRRSFDAYPITPFAVAIDGRLQLALLPGESMTCDWFQIKAEPGA